MPHVILSVLERNHNSTLPPSPLHHLPPSQFLEREPVGQLLDLSRALTVGGLELCKALGVWGRGGGGSWGRGETQINSKDNILPGEGKKERKSSSLHGDPGGRGKAAPVTNKRWTKVSQIGAKK